MCLVPTINLLPHLNYLHRLRPLPSSPFPPQSHLLLPLQIQPLTLCCLSLSLPPSPQHLPWPSLPWHRPQLLLPHPRASSCLESCSMKCPHQDAIFFNTLIKCFCKDNRIVGAFRILEVDSVLVLTKRQSWRNTAGWSYILFLTLGNGYNMYDVFLSNWNSFQLPNRKASYFSYIHYQWKTCNVDVWNVVFIGNEGSLKISNI